MRDISYCIITSMAIIFSTELGIADGLCDRAKKKALWMKALIFAIGFVAGMLMFV